MTSLRESNSNSRIPHIKTKIDFELLTFWLWLRLFDFDFDFLTFCNAISVFCSHWKFILNYIEGSGVNMNDCDTYVTTNFIFNLITNTIHIRTVCCSICAAMTMILRTLYYCDCRLRCEKIWNESLLLLIDS